MSDAVATKVLFEDDVTYVGLFTNASDGTGESEVKKVDVSALDPVCYLVSIDEIMWSCHGVGVDILWVATTDVLTWVLPANSSGHIKFRDLGGALVNTKAAGYDGDISFTATGSLASAGHGYSIILKCTKTR